MDHQGLTLLILTLPLAYMPLQSSHPTSTYPLSPLHSLELIPTLSRSPAGTIQITLATAHPAKFSEAVESALAGSSAFNFERDVLPDEFKGLLQRERRVVQVGGLEDVRKVIEETEGRRANEATGASV